MIFVTFFLDQYLFLFHQSHTVGRGPEFARNVFNIQGQSPLVAHFLRMKNLQDDAGMVIRVQRTEVDSLPPYPFTTSHNRGRAPGTLL